VGFTINVTVCVSGVPDTVTVRVEVDTFDELKSLARNTPKPTIKTSAITMRAEIPREIALLSLKSGFTVTKVELEVFENTLSQGCSEI